MSDQLQFANMVRSLFNIDGYLLPELTREQQGEFVRDPVRYFIATDKAQQDAIYREVLKRQPPAADDALELLKEVIAPYSIYDRAVVSSQAGAQDEYLALGRKIKAAIAKAGAA